MLILIIAKNDLADSKRALVSLRVAPFLLSGVGGSEFQAAFSASPILGVEDRSFKLRPEEPAE
jgi:hypothetical protein